MTVKEKEKTVASVILKVEDYEEVKRIAKKNRRSASSQMAIAIEEMITRDKLQL